MTLYCHRQLGLFLIRVVDVDESGFVFRKRRYAWTDVAGIREWDPGALAGYPAAIPRACISLADGRTIRLNGRVLEKGGVKPKVGFSSGRSDAFDELLSLFRSKLVKKQA